MVVGVYAYPMGVVPTRIEMNSRVRQEEEEEEEEDACVMKLVAHAGAKVRTSRPSTCAESLVIDIVLPGEDNRFEEDRFYDYTRAHREKKPV
ncbi:hypothetical protein M0804_006595 [Polistes exclamans]|nr:hypothetical protein M0804_006595 [Polistes exclamans]